MLSTHVRAALLSLSLQPMHTKQLGLGTANVAQESLGTMGAIMIRCAATVDYGCDAMNTYQNTAPCQLQGWTVE
jgi:hypothetical protein